MSKKPVSEAAFPELSIPHLRELQRSADIGSRIVSFWSEPQNQRAATWSEHRDINEVMLATALLDAYVGTAETGPVSKAHPA